MPEAYGGSGVDRLYSMILIEEQAYAGDSASWFFTAFRYCCQLHSITLAQLNKNNTGYPAWLQVKSITAIAMTEPGTGSTYKLYVPLRYWMAMNT